MTNDPVIFKEISLLVTHYNRSLSLERLLAALEKQQIRFNEIIVSDDGSKKEHLDKLNQLKVRFDFKLLCSEKNKGLANNINKGQRAVLSPYTLYIQEDFIPTDKFRACLTNGLELMKEDSTIDLVRFYAYEKHPYLKPVKNGFAEMKFNFWYPSYWQFHCYSDHPHLKRSSFLEKFGDYKEGIQSDKAEFKMALSFLKKGGKSLIHDDYQGIFIQDNSSEPSQISRKDIRSYIQSRKFFMIKFARMLYRNIKARYRYLFW